jgi:hypothetical protein
MLAKGYHRMGYVTRENGKRLFLGFVSKERVATSEVDIFEEDAFLGKVWCICTGEVFESGRVATLTGLRDDISFILKNGVHLGYNLKQEDFGSYLDGGIGSKMFMYKSGGYEYKGFMGYGNFKGCLLVENKEIVLVDVVNEYVQEVMENRASELEMLGINRDKLLTIMLSVGNKAETKLTQEFDMKGNLVRTIMVHDERILRIIDRENKANKLEHVINWVI